MLCRNIKYYRIVKGLTEKQLGQRLSISRNKVLKYESGEEIPNLEMARKIALVLGVRLANLLAETSSGHVYEHGEYRKRSDFSKKGQEYVRKSVENYLDRFFAVTELLGGKVLRDTPKVHSLKPSGNAEKDAVELRAMLGFAKTGAIPNLLSSLEDKGILIVQMDYADSKFSGMNGLADGRPYIVLNRRMTAERQRSTLVHELGHVFFALPQGEWSNWERYMTAVSGAFLFPQDDALSELGKSRKMISSDMLMVCEEYGISLQMLAKRAHVLKIITDKAYKIFNIKMNISGMRKNEPSRIAIEEVKMFEQLVLRAIAEENMTLQKGAELLKIPCIKLADKLMPEGTSVLNDTVE